MYEIAADNSRPLLSASWNRSSTATGTNTQFSGLGNTPMGELQSLNDDMSEAW